MLTKITSIVTRPSVSVPFFNWPKETVQYVKDKYDTTNKRLSIEMSMSEDKLTQTVVVLWVKGAFEEWSEDPGIKDVRIAQRAYNQENGIKGTSTHEDIEG